MLKQHILQTDILIIGGGTAGCYAALTAAENSPAKVIIAEKAHIKRSGCLAAGVNALNAYINAGETPDTYLEYVKKDSEGIIREDLVYSIAQGLNRVTQKIESLGLPILKDAAGKYVARGKRSVKINGENIKPILAKAVYEHASIDVLNHVNMVDYLLKDGRVIGAYGFSVKEKHFCVIFAKAVICATGGASGLYKPNNSGFSRHKMWYSPFNTGAGYAMGIRAGAEMTTFEMRFIALRCKDTIAPTGTIAQGIKAEQVNSIGEEYVSSYGKPSTSMRLYATVMENRKGKGPCYLKSAGITQEEEQELYKAYLNMAPAQVLKWMETGKVPSKENVEIEGTEPYIVGGHTASGYWVDINRATSIKGLFAAGDVAGGSPKKYVTGCFVEGEIAAMSALDYISTRELSTLSSEEIQEKYDLLVRYLTAPANDFSVHDLEEAMQKVMDEYAGGISTSYGYNSKKLIIAQARIDELLHMTGKLAAKDMHELLHIHDVIDRLYVCKAVIAHLLARKETRWRCYQENLDYPKKDDANYFKYINSRYVDGEIQILFKDIVKKDEQYEHKG